MFSIQRLSHTPLACLQYQSVIQSLGNVPATLTALQSLLSMVAQVGEANHPIVSISIRKSGTSFSSTSEDVASQHPMQILKRIQPCTWFPILRPYENILVLKRGMSLEVPGDQRFHSFTEYLIQTASNHSFFEASSCVELLNCIGSIKMERAMSSQMPLNHISNTFQWMSNRLSFQPITSV